MSDFVEKTEEPKPAEEKKTPNDNDEGEEGGDSTNPEEESTATFTPLVHLTEIEVKTFEEEEEVLFHKRAKLYVFGESLLNKGKGIKTWNERGTGDMKILKHKDTAHIRILMRQEKTMKIIANHILDYRIQLVPKFGVFERSRLSLYLGTI